MTNTTKKKSWIEEGGDYFSKVAKTIDSGQKWAQQNRVTGISATESVPGSGVSRSSVPDKTRQAQTRNNYQKQIRATAYLNEVKKTFSGGQPSPVRQTGNTGNGASSTHGGAQAGTKSRSGVQQAATNGSENQLQRLQAYIDEVLKMMDLGQKWAQQNNAQGLSATESAPARLDRAAYQNELSKTVQKQAQQVSSTVQRMQAYLNEVLRGIDSGQKWAQQNNAQGLSAAESVGAENANTWEEYLENQKTKGHEAFNDDNLKYFSAHLGLPILSFTDGINGLVGVQADDEKRAEKLIKELEPSQSDMSRWVADGANFLSDVGFSALMRSNFITNALTNASDFGAGMKAVREKGGNLGNQILGGMAKNLESNVISRISGSLGDEIGQKIAGQIENMTPQMRKEYMKTLSQLLSIDVETLYRQLWGRSEEPVA